MAQFLNMYSVDLQKPTGPKPLRQTVCEGDNAANRIGAIVTSDGESVSLGGSCVGKVVRADGATVQLSGTISGNQAYVVLDQASCAVVGQIQVAVCWVSGSNVTTLVVAYGSVVKTQTGNAIQPSTPIPDLTQLLAEIDEMRAATAAATAAATGALANFAGAFVAAAAYPAGTYVTYTDGYLYVLPDGHDANVIWANTTKTKVNVGGELTDVRRTLNDIEDVLPIETTTTSEQLSATDGKFWDISSNPVSLGNHESRAYCEAIAISPGDELSVTGYEASSTYYHLVVIVDDQYNLLWNSPDVGSTQEVTISKIAPSRSAYLLLTTPSTSTKVRGVSYTIIHKSLVDLKDYTENAVNDGIMSKVATAIPYALQYESPFYWKSSDGIGSTSEKTRLSGWLAYSPIPAESGHTYIAKIYQGTATSNAPVICVDNSFKVLSKYLGTASSFNTFTFVAPETTKYVLLSKYNAQNTPDTEFYERSIPDSSDILYPRSMVVSIMGDSISTFAEDAVTVGSQKYAPEGCTTNYPGNRVRYPYGTLVTSLNQMWWKIVLDHFGWTLGINEAYAGSVICGVTGSGSSIEPRGADYCMASDTRIGHLDDNGTPDIILVYGGTNDINHNTGDGKTIGTLPQQNIEDFSGVEFDLDTFYDAAFAMLLKMQHSYPKAKIICILPYFCTSRDTYSTTPIDVKQHNDAMIEICDYLGVEYVDLRKIVNVYDTDVLYGGDDVLHPNATGMKMIAEMVIKKIYTMLLK